MDNLNSVSRGKLAETTALQYLQQHGLRLVTQNYRCKVGEIDLIMQAQNAEIVFVEVRLRNNPHFASAAETVDFFKQQKIIKTATYFLQQQNWLDKVNCRFDVIGISYVQTKAMVEWLPDAFTSDNF